MVTLYTLFATAVTPVSVIVRSVDASAKSRALITGAPVAPAGTGRRMSNVPAPAVMLIWRVLVTSTAAV